jgi:hypothetical protein
MKTFSISIILYIIYFSTVSGQETKVIRPGIFTGVRVSSKIDAELILAREPAVEINFNDADVGCLIAEVDESILKLRMKTGKYNQEDLKVKIYYTGDLIEISSDGRANIWSDEELYLTGIKMNLSNGGSIRLKTVADHLDAELAQGSILVISGKAGKLDLKVSTAATFSGYDLQVEEADILANSGGKAKVSVSRYLKAKAISGGWIGYLADPEKIDSQASLKGEIVKTEIEE